MRNSVRWLLPLLLAACIARLWVMPLTSSFWVDEMATAFVVHHGVSDPTLKVAPQVAASIYYVLPRAAERLLGFSEWAYRLPSVLALGLALWFVARIASRLLGAGAAWIAVFCCLTLRVFDDQAADARPYALGTCVACAAMWLLLRWLDGGRWRDAAWFAAVAALVCQVHLIFWPLYIVFGIFALFWGAAPRAQRVAVCAALAAGVGAVVVPAWSLLREAGAHVVADQPTAGDLAGALRLASIAAVAAAGLALAKWRGWPIALPAKASLAAIAAWWLVDPIALFAFSHVTGYSVFVSRYLIPALPGAALALTAGIVLTVPVRWQRPLALAIGVGVLAFTGSWRRVWPTHHNSNWRAAAAEFRELALPADVPVLCVSPFIEARPPVWRVDYPMDSFLYSNLLYPVPGRLYPFPFEPTHAAERETALLWNETLASSPGFALYGTGGAVGRWHDWFRTLPGIDAWRDRVIRGFGDVDIDVFEGPTWPSPQPPMPNHGSAANRPGAPAR